MNEQCQKEQIVVESFKSGFVGEEIAAHISYCRVCRETAQIVRFFQTNTINNHPPKRLPAAGLIWWKFQLRERRHAAERVSKPIFIAQFAAIFFAFATFLWLTFRGSTGFSSIDSGFSRVLDSMEQIVVPLTFGLIFFTVASAAVIFVLRRFTVEK